MYGLLTSERYAPNPAELERRLSAESQRTRNKQNSELTSQANRVA